MLRGCVRISSIVNAPSYRGHQWQVPRWEQVDCCSVGLPVEKKLDFPWWLRLGNMSIYASISFGGGGGGWWGFALRYSGWSWEAVSSV